MSKFKAIIFDFSRTLIFSKDSTYEGKFNDLYKQIVLQENYNFFEYFTLNNELIDFLKPLKGRLILTIYTTEIIQNDPAIRPIFDQLFSSIFSAKDLGTTKKDPAGYLIIAKTLKEKPENILFIDDTLGNLEAASKAGLQTIHFTSNEQLFKQLDYIIIPTP